MKTNFIRRTEILAFKEHISNCNVLRKFETDKRLQKRGFIWQRKKKRKVFSDDW